MARAHPQTRRGASAPLATLLTGAGAFLLLLVALALLLPALLRPEAEARGREQARRGAEHAAGTLAARLEQELEGISSRETIADLREHYPDALRILEVDGDGLTPAPRAVPPVGYALSEQVEAAIHRGRASAEVHFPGTPDGQLNLVAPADDGARGGHPAGGTARDWLKPLGSPRAVSLHRGDMRIVQQGAAGGPAARATLPGRDWTVEVRVPPPQLPLAFPFPLVFGLGVVGLASAGVGAALRRRTVTTGPEPVDHPDPVADAPPAMPTAERPPPEPSRPATPVAETGRGSRDQDEHPGEPPPHRSGTGEVIPPGILRAYDVRGTVDRTLTVEVVARLGHAIGTDAREAGQRRVVVGRDGRHSSPRLADALIRGLAHAGCAVLDVGAVPTPILLDFATRWLGTDAGLMVTGSHNPPEYNGLKIMLGGETLSGSAISALGEKAAGAPPDPPRRISRRWTASSRHISTRWPRISRPAGHCGWSWTAGNG
ncbi:MAG: hypothetical protein U5L11_02170 [Arhodomonas sp.]|nr:hypothetical protein [Arhodomonas sp.]